MLKIILNKIFRTGFMKRKVLCLMASAFVCLFMSVISPELCFTESTLGISGSDSKEMVFISDKNGIEYKFKIAEIIKMIIR